MRKNQKEQRRQNKYEQHHRLDNKGEVDTLK